MLMILNPSNGEKEEPIKVDDHCADALRYLVMGMWTKIRRWLPVQEDDR